MKSKKHVFLGLFLLFATSYIFAQCGVIASGNKLISCGDSTVLLMQPKWGQELDQLPGNFHSVYFNNKDIGYTIGGAGVIRKTTNGGTNWLTQYSNSNVSLFGITFTSLDTGYVVGSSGSSSLVLKTIDGGTNWTDLSVGSFNGLFSVWFINANVGFAVGASGTVLKTIDAGVTWIQKPTGTTATSLSSVYFPDPLIGYACGNNGGLLKTTDNGETWSSLPSITNAWLTATHFISKDTGYTAGTDGIYKTTDGGITWSHFQPSVNVNFESLFFTNANTGYAGGGNVIYSTIDGGKTWTPQQVALQYAEHIYFPEPNIGYAVGDKTIKYVVPDAISWSPSNGLSANNIANPIAKPLITTKYKIFATTGTCIATDSVTITVNPFTIDAGSNKTLICGGSVQLDNVTSNYTGTGNLTYSWFPTGGLNASTIANPIVTVKQNTNYYVTVTTPDGCTATDSVVVTVDPLKANAGSDKILTCGNTVQLDQVSSNYSGTGNLTYVWSPATGLNSTTISNPTATIKQTAAYGVTVTTPNGCTSTDSVTIFVGPLTAEAGANKTIVCGAGAQLGITTNYTGGGALTYAWSPSTGLNLSYIANPVASPTQTTKYYVNITTPNGCKAADSITVIVDPLTADAGSDKTLICGGTAQFEVLTNYSGSGSLNYAWSPNSGLNLSNIANPTASVIQNTSFVINVTTVNGCKAFDTVKVIVSPLMADAGPDKTMTCGSESQLLVTSNYTGSGSPNYAWTPSSGLNLSNISNPVVSVSKTTKFYVSVKTVNGCIAKDSINVIVNPLTVNAGSDKSHICGGSIQLDSATTNYNGNGALTYYWSPASGLNNAVIPNPVSSGVTTYTLTVTSPFGNCEATDQVKVDIAPLNGEEICMVTLDSTNKNVILWNKQELSLIDSFLIYKETSVAGVYMKIGSQHKSAPTIFRDITSKPDVSSSKYRISIKDSCGVETSFSTPHKTMHLTINKGIGTSWNLIWEAYEGFQVSSYIIYRGTDPKNLQFLDATSGSNTQYTDNNPPLGDVYYQLEIIKPTSCNPAKPISSSRSNVASSNPVGISELKNGFSFSVYPNPTSDVIMISSDRNNNKNTTLMIYNAMGALVKTIALEQNNQQVNVSDLSNGFYTIELRSAGTASKQKLTIQK